MPIKLNSTGGGSITIDVPNMSTANTLTLPAITGNVITSSDSGTVTQSMMGSNVVGNTPMFHAGSLSGQSIPNSTWTKMVLASESFDTNNFFDSTTNYRFLPTIAGYYYLYGQFAYTGSATNHTQISFYKNGTISLNGTGCPNNTSVGGKCYVGGLIYLNGSSDYVELYTWQNSGGSLALQSDSNSNYFGGYLLRRA